MKKLMDVTATVSRFGSIFSVLLELEGHTVDLHLDGGQLVAQLTDFPVEDELDAYFQCKGINGAYCRLEVSAASGGGKPVVARRKVVVAKGVGRVSFSMHV